MDQVAGAYDFLCVILSNINYFHRFPEQRISRQEALRGINQCSYLCKQSGLIGAWKYLGMTIDPAYASFTETVLGSLEVGKRADYVVLSRDIMTVPEDAILATQVLTTVIDGKPVYGDT